MRITGDKAIEKMFTDYGKALPLLVKKKFWHWAFVLANDAKRHAPAHTGILKDSIRGDVEKHGDRLVGVYGTNVHYAQFVEFGTSRIRVGTPERPRTSWPAKRATNTTSPETMPYIRPAWLRHHNALEHDLESAGGEVKL